jgi:acetyl-CoA C-acetyltransferase
MPLNRKPTPPPLNSGSRGLLSVDIDGSYRRAAQAWQSGLFTPEIAPVTQTTKKGPLTITEDEEFKALKLDKVQTLKPAFKKDGTVTAANASSINDGASALVLSTLQKSKDLPGKPIARILSWADAATKPIDFTIAPSLAIPIALKRAGLQVKDIAKWELNEVPSPSNS